MAQAVVADLAYGDGQAILGERVHKYINYTKRSPAFIEKFWCTVMRALLSAESIQLVSRFADPPDDAVSRAVVFDSNYRRPLHR